MANSTLKLKGYVGGWDFDADYIEWFLYKNKDKDVTVQIDSLGGSVYAAMSVVNAFRNHGKVNVHFVGFNASAATIVSMGAKHISIDEHAMYLVHKTSQFVCEVAMCNADETKALIDKLDRDRQDLEKIDLNIASMYAARCKRSKEDLLALMKKGGWLSAQEALDWGFVDEVTKDSSAEYAEISDVVATAMACEGIPMPPGFDRKKSGLLRRISDAIAAIFDFSNSTIIDKMAKILPLICSVLSVDDVVFTNGKTEITEAQADKLEKALSEKDAQISSLQASIAEKDEQIANLKNASADDSKAVISNGAEAHADVNDFLREVEAAKKMFNSIP